MAGFEKMRDGRKARNKREEGKERAEASVRG